MRFARHEISEKKLMDLVPVANVVLLLIFCFLLSWSFVSQPGVEVKLPMTSFQSASQQGRHVVTLKAFNKDEVLIFFNEKSVDASSLKNYLKQAAEKAPGAWITLNADELVSHGVVQQVSAQMMELGFHVTIATQRTAVISHSTGTP